MFGKSKNDSVSADQLMAEFLEKKQQSQTQEKSSELEIKFKALWELLQEKLGLTEQDLEAQISIIEERETKLKEAPKVLKKENCSKCNRPVSIKTGICIYCGKE